MQKQYDLDESTAHATIDRIKKQKANDEKKGEGEAEEGTNVGEKRTRRSQVILRHAVALAALHVHMSFMPCVS
jgi:tellurite resistance protein